MSIVNDIQQLVARSKLFADAEKLDKVKDKKIDRKRGKRGREAIKMGQGGTLDPLADGVLGLLLPLSPSASTSNAQRQSLALTRALRN